MDDETPLSKTQRKQQMHALQELGERLVALKREQLEQLRLPENLLDSILEAKRLTRHEAIRRQMQYIGRIMRAVDSAPIQARLDEWTGASRAQAARVHMIERWRERLLEDEAALGELMVQYPRADSQRLRTLLRNTLQEQLAHKPPRSSRALFRELRDLMQPGGEPDSEEESAA